MGNKTLSDYYLTTLKISKKSKWYEAAMVSKVLPRNEDIDLFIEEVKKELARGIV